MARDRLPQLAPAHVQARAKTAELEIRRPYDLRHAFASLLLHEGRSLVYVAEQLGHTVATLSADYAHVIAELRHQPPLPAAEAILRARRAHGEGTRDSRRWGTDEKCSARAAQPLPPPQS